MVLEDVSVDLPVLSAPADGVPAVVDTADGLAAHLETLGRGHGPIALDVERAQSYRYSGKAYLVQVRRPGAGTFLVDPIAFETPDQKVAQFPELQQLIGDQEWILHAATQDLPNLVALGLRPSRLFDTELAGRLLGLPRVSLGLMAERYCGVRLLKEHSAVDWSARPIPEDWLRYAALDVELLHELRAKLLAELTAAGKAEWASQEFDWEVRAATRPVTERTDRWRRTSGTHAIRSPRGLAIVRELWQTRDRIARAMDKAPGKVLQDKAITELGALVTRQHPKMPTTTELRQIEGFKRRTARQHQDEWLAALDRVAALPNSGLPPLRVPAEGLPAIRNWDRIKPEAAERWERVRPAVVGLAEELAVPVENLINPEALRQLLWQPRTPISVAGVAAQLADLDARPWQQELIAPLVTELLAD